MARGILRGCFWLVLFTVASAVAHEAGASLEGPLGADDECEAGDGGAAGECSVELRQLRARSVKAETKDEVVAASEEGSELFGPNARGRNMWRARTWTDIAALVQFNESVQGPCVAQTGATCSTFACKASRGATDCVKMQCQCATGFCAQAGTCYPTSPTQCLEDTGGSCTVSACLSSQGDIIAAQVSASATLEIVLGRGPAFRPRTQAAHARPLGAIPPGARPPATKGGAFVRMERRRERNLRVAHMKSLLRVELTEAPSPTRDDQCMRLKFDSGGGGLFFSVRLGVALCCQGRDIDC
eukprot:CAMPEP_0183422242 /NCGR_PEP_ID=MMETSP0370-20130417/27676_1 /TAXON_ID=268820 /ORGANISM="Peridinium aciculiferum, Strain PAER-2" /LENGTH=298 /DNA_ID=CAMNT_0025606315 /DNA_START=92 /DNA_END=990 /DNA_ORIENTATION=+